MILERHRELTINLGNNTYESAKISARVTLSEADLTEDELKECHQDYRSSQLAEKADVLLTEALEAEVKYWHEITTKKDSFIHLVQQDNEGRKNA